MTDLPLHPDDLSHNNPQSLQSAANVLITTQKDNLRIELDEDNLPERKRSTSTSKDLKNQPGFLPPAIAGKPDEEGNKLLCHLPEKFYFGKYEYIVPPLPRDSDVLLV